MKSVSVKFRMLTFLLGVSVVSCGKSNSSTPPVVDTSGNNTVVSFTANNATSAYNDFNKYLYNSGAKLYYRASDKSGIAAIWTQAIYFDMAMNAWRRTGDAQYKQLIEDIYQGNYQQYAGYDWTNQDKWFIWDDMMWWIIALARAYETTGDQKYLDHAKAGFNFVWNGDASLGRVGSYDPATGGMEWAWKQRGKTACINYPTVIGAMTLYNITKDEDYATKAVGVYNWARTNLFNNSTGAVADNKVDNNPADWTPHTYNQASCIGAAVMLYKKTGDAAYLNDAVLAADYTKNKMSDVNGILPFEGGEEQGVYNAILAQYIIRLIQDGNKPDYLPWLRKNINTAYGKRSSATGLMGKDYKTPPPAGTPVSAYDACSIPALMQVVPPEK
ncbi:MAG: glycoside hydrolase family 76 protein [Chitinophagaceae bacterium]|nr:glycoside hydrolase family 76 protein [Chitinophagaceae bacterium]